MEQATSEGFTAFLLLSTFSGIFLTLLLSFSIFEP